MRGLRKVPWWAWAAGLGGIAVLYLIGRRTGSQTQTGNAAPQQPAQPSLLDFAAPSGASADVGIGGSPIFNPGAVGQPVVPPPTPAPITSGGGGGGGGSSTSSFSSFSSPGGEAPAGIDYAAGPNSRGATGSVSISPWVSLTPTQANTFLNNPAAGRQLLPGGQLPV